MNSNSTRSSRRVAVQSVAAAAAILLASTAYARLSLPDLFADHMVLQREAPVRLWGNAEPGDQVHVRIDRSSGDAAVLPDGTWTVQLPPMHAGGPYAVELADDEHDRVELHDVLVGDVWLAAGQSNMAFRMAPQLPWTLGVPDFEKELAAADDARVRVYTVVTESVLEPETQSHGLWETCTPQHARDFSAVAYFFARRISAGQHVPVGMLVAAVGATPIESWMDAPAYAAALPAEARKQLAADRGALAAAGGDGTYRKSLIAYRAGVRRALPVDGPLPSIAPPYSNYPFQATGFFNGMIAPLQRVPIKGVLWYQGEANADRPGRYPALFEQLAKQWRSQWGEADLPIDFVQLPNFDPVKDWALQHSQAAAAAMRGKWALMREAQAKGLRVPHTDMAVTADVGSPTLIHPRDKKTVGDRLALLALADTYGEPVVAHGPAFENSTIEGRSIVLHFASPGGLVLRPSAESGFEVAGDDGKFMPAEATVRNETVVLTSSTVACPTSGRYAWSDTPVPTLFNSGGLPASPFRTGR